MTKEQTVNYAQGVAEKSSNASGSCVLQRWWIEQVYDEYLMSQQAADVYLHPL